LKVAERQAELVKADVERLVLLGDILGVVLDTDVDDAAFGLTVRSLGPERLARQPGATTIVCLATTAAWN